MANDLRLSVLLSTIDRATAPLRQINRSSQATAQGLKAARERLRDLNAQQRDVAGWRTQLNQARQTSQALQQAQERVRAVARQMAAAGSPTQAMTQQMRRAVDEARRLSQAQQQQSASLQQTRARLQAAGIQTRNLASHERDLRTQIAAANDSISAQTQRLRQLGAQEARVAAARAKLGKAQQLGAHLATTGAGAVASGSAALYTGARLIQPGLEFDAAMSKVQALARLDKGDESYQALRAQARELGANTSFTATDAAQGQGYLAMAGFDPKAIKQAMPGMLDLAKAGDSGLAETADIASNILTGMNLKAEDMGRLGDVLVGTFTRSNTNLQMLGETMKYVAPVASGVGQDLETVAAMAGKLGDSAIQGSMGGTALRSILLRLSAPPAEAAKALKTLGINTADAQGNLRDLPTVLQEIYEKTQHMGTIKRTALISKIAGTEAVAGMQVLVAQAGTGDLQRFIQTLKSAQNEAQRTAKVMADNLAGDLDTLTSSWQDLGIELQTQQNGPLRDVVQTITGLIRSIKRWASENPQLAAGLVKTAAVAAALVAGMGALSIALASMLGPFVLMRYGLTLLGLRGLGVLPVLGRLIGVLRGGLVAALRTVGVAMWALAANPVVLTIAAIVAVVAGAAYLIHRHWDSLRAKTTEAWTAMVAVMTAIVDRMRSVILAFNPYPLLQGAFAAALDYLRTLPTDFAGLGGMIVDGLVAGLLGGLDRVKAAIGNLGSGTIDWFKDKLDIHSPSRVFAELGGFTTQGLAQGLEAGAAEPLAAMNRMSQRLVQAGDVRMGSAGSGVDVGRPRIAFDDRAPLSASAGASYSSNDRYEINIHPAPGADTQAIAKAVRAELARIEADKAARRRSRLTDLE
ncbi:phage tail tape measure protein [Pseudomonas entomophila]|uniref:phage tail tape measure protein n=1 Tax=Pseudomonas entomophila TaxID=312306 RepID=UPI0015E39FFF|nr:phage tail tape measure protein [Pseudomonas entomophila]MBA1187554.1 phage tail tape measure protein [Pseudomonas entomophila]